jgi:hypothetical protein
MSKELIDILFLLDSELEQIGYTKVGLIWIIADKRYKCKQATKDGHYFVEI